MPQGKKDQTSKATRSLNDGNPTELADNQRLEKREDGSVWLIETSLRVIDKDTTEESQRERRVDSAADDVAIARGDKVWWKELLEKQEAPKPKANRKTPSKKTEE